MAEKSPQSFEHHTRILPAFHYVAFPLFVINFGLAVYQTVADFTWPAMVHFGTSVALLLLFFLSRLMAITVQDRVIRLEERIRMRELLPADLQPRINDFSVKQLVALRFASDDQLPALARRVLDETLKDQKTIKKLVTHWREDHQRA